VFYLRKYFIGGGNMDEIEEGTYLEEDNEWNDE
jgi:hypothetical protein